MYICHAKCTFDKRNILSRHLTFASSKHTPSLWCGNPSSEEDGWAYGRELMERRLLGALFWIL